MNWRQKCWSTKNASLYKSKNWQPKLKIKIRPLSSSRSKETSSSKRAKESPTLLADRDSHVTLVMEMHLRPAKLPQLRSTTSIAAFYAAQRAWPRVIWSSLVTFANSDLQRREASTRASKVRTVSMMAGWALTPAHPSRTTTRTCHRMTKEICLSNNSSNTRMEPWDHQ